jgi:hypothetical protein
LKFQGFTNNNICPVLHGSWFLFRMGSLISRPVYTTKNSMQQYILQRTICNNIYHKARPQQIFNLKRPSTIQSCRLPQVKNLHITTATAAQGKNNNSSSIIHNYSITLSITLSQGKATTNIQQIEIATAAPQKQVKHMLVCCFNKQSIVVTT